MSAFRKIGLGDLHVAIHPKTRQTEERQYSMDKQNDENKDFVDPANWPQPVGSQSFHKKRELVAGHGIQNGISHREGDTKKKGCKKSVYLKAWADNP